MIIFSEKGKELFYPKSWDEVFERTGYDKNVDPDSIDVVQMKMLARYGFEVEQPCGLSSCHRSHGRGYVISCGDGRETSIGHICGQKRFGFHWKSMKNTFDRDINEKKWRQNVGRFRNQVDNFNLEFRHLRDGNNQGLWCHDKMKSLMERDFDSKTSNSLNRRASNQDFIVNEEIRLSEEEMELRKVTGDISQYKYECIGTIAGLSATLNYRKLKTILEVTLGSDVKEYKAINFDVEDYDTLKKWNRWVLQFEIKIKEIKEIIIECHRFLVANNIKFIVSNKYWINR